MGGGGADDIDAGLDASPDIAVGDNGHAVFSDTGQLERIETTSPDLGDDDQILVGDGDDVVLGGQGDDFINTDRTGAPVGSDSGDDIVRGDNGWAEFTAGIVAYVQTSSPDQGGDDWIFTDSGSDIVLGGRGGDHIDAGQTERGDAARDIVLGDHGSIEFSDTGAVSQLTSTDPNLGGADWITTGGGPDLIIGGDDVDNIDSVPTMI